MYGALPHLSFLLGRFLNIYFRIPDGGLASWFWASSSNTLSSVYHGLLGDYCSAVTVSPYGRRSTKDHLPQEQELGAAFARMFMTRILPLSLRSVLSQYYYAQTGSFCLVLSHADWLALFQINLLQNECVNSLFYSFDSRLV